jgi:hypothetical protein
MTITRDPLFVREETADYFDEDPALADPETRNMVECAEDELQIALLNQGISPAEFERALTLNLAGFFDWVELSLAVKH